MLAKLFDIFSCSYTCILCLEIFVTIRLVPDNTVHMVRTVGSFLENLSIKRPDEEVGEIRRWSMNLRSRRIICFNLT